MSPFFNWIKKNIAIVLTTITTLLVAYITIYGTHKDQQDKFSNEAQAFARQIHYQDSLNIKQLKHQDSLNAMDYNFKKAQLLQQFMPSLLSKDPATVKLAILSFWNMDTTFAISTAMAINTQGAKSALTTISFYKVKSVMNKNFEISTTPITSNNYSKGTLINPRLIRRKIATDKTYNKTENTSLSPSNIALINAYSELGKAKLPNSLNLVNKYLDVAGVPRKSDWSVPFIIWCFSDGQKALLNIKTNDLTTFYQQLKQRNFILNPSDTVLPGDIVFFNFQENKGAEQCGIVSSTDSDYVYTIEGDNNGEAVSTHIRYKADAMAFARIYN